MSSTIVSRTRSPSIVTLASWQLRQAWRLLLVVGMGIVASVILVCSVLLYSQLAMTAGLRGVLTSSSQNADIVVRSSSSRISTPVINITTRHLNAEFQKQLGPYLTPPQFSLLTQPLSILAGSGGHLHQTPDVIALSGASMQASTSHVTLLQGRLPQNKSDEFEIALRPESAALLHVSTGAVLNVNISFLDANQTLSTQNLALHIVGIFTLSKVDDPYWHGNDFMYSFISENATFYRGLVSNETILSHLNQISDKAASNGKVFEKAANVYWYYRLNTSHLTISDLDGVIAGAQTVKVDDSNNTDLEQSPYLEQSVTYLPSTY